MVVGRIEPLSFLAILFLIALAAVFLLISLSFAAFVLKSACRVLGVEVPDTGKAMVISFLESLCCTGAYLAALVYIWFIGKSFRADPTAIAAFVGLAVFTLAFVVPALLYVPMLRVSFPKGLVLAVLRYVITTSIMLMFGLAVGVATGKYKLH